MTILGKYVATAWVRSGNTALRHRPVRLPRFQIYRDKISEMPEGSYRHEVSNWDTPGEPKVTATAHGSIYRVGILCKRGGTAQ
jgi:hypothetical protein